MQDTPSPVKHPARPPTPVAQLARESVIPLPPRPVHSPAYTPLQAERAPIVLQVLPLLAAFLHQTPPTSPLGHLIQLALLLGCCLLLLLD